MANIKANEKSNKQDTKRNAINRSFKSEIKTAMKKAASDKKIESVDHAVKLINSAVTKGIFHKNKAARLVSKMHTIETKPATETTSTTPTETK